PKHIDRGIRKRAILAIGKQDIEFDHLIPLDKDVQILGGSSDHMVVDVNESEYEVGDIIQFYPFYPSILKFMCSKNKKRYIRGL
ncbi:MAG: alanine/ornithine racemase family PLP-dependent enzyme, partial [Thermoplasmata archaeon]